MQYNTLRHGRQGSNLLAGGSAPAPTAATWSVSSGLSQPPLRVVCQTKTSPMKLTTWPQHTCNTLLVLSATQLHEVNGSGVFATTWSIAPKKFCHDSPAKRIVCQTCPALLEAWRSVSATTCRSPFEKPLQLTSVIGPTSPPFFSSEFTSPQIVCHVPSVLWSVCHKRLLSIATSFLGVTSGSCAVDIDRPVIDSFVMARLVICYAYSTRWSWFDRDFRPRWSWFVPSDHACWETCDYLRR